jgi:hypothetical protein
MGLRIADCGLRIVQAASPPRIPVAIPQSIPQARDNPQCHASAFGFPFRYFAD